MFENNNSSPSPDTVYFTLSYILTYQWKQHLFFCRGINFRDMAKLKTTDIQYGFTKKGEPMKYFIY